MAVRRRLFKCSLKCFSSCMLGIMSVFGGKLCQGMSDQGHYGIFEPSVFIAGQSTPWSFPKADFVLFLCLEMTIYYDTSCSASKSVESRNSQTAYKFCNFSSTMLQERLLSAILEVHSGQSFHSDRLKLLLLLEALSILHQDTFYYNLNAPFANRL